jgi:trimeric autotransporter adhesin
MFNHPALQTVQNQLAHLATHSNFSSIIATAFGNRINQSLLQILRQQWLSGNFSVIPEIQVLSAAEIGSAEGAYSADLDRIFISADYLAVASTDSIAAVILEEVGHRIDQWLNGGVDSAGDEGEIFSRLVNGENLSSTALAGLRTQNDHGVVNLNGQLIAVENAVVDGNDLPNYMALDSFFSDLRTTNNNDLIRGFRGGDTIDGAGGNDTIEAGTGDDSVNGGAGNDNINLGDDNDTLNGFGGGDDTINGGNGNDRLDGSFGNEIYFGGEGNDTILGREGNDSIEGGGGNDTIDGGTGDDLVVGDRGFDSVDGGNGNDTWDISTTTFGYVFDLATGITNFSGHTASNFENVLTGSGNDSISGSLVDNIIRTGAGNDTINASSGDDSVDGGGGDDDIKLGDGDDIFNGTVGGNDTVDGGNGNDSLDGNFGNDSLFGGGGNDTIVGRDGNDTLFGSVGNDSLIGGDGNDVYRVDGNDTINDSSGVDTVISTTTYTLDLNIENLTLIDGEPTALNGFGNGLSNIITGNGLSNTLEGGAGNDTLLGSNGDDTLRGGEGNDAVVGGEGEDRLSSSAGDDILRGGNGNDVYFINDLDTIFEFDGGGVDTIVAEISYTLGDFLEKLELTGINDTAIIGAGNALANNISGNQLNNVLSGGADNDSLLGGSGNDTLDGGTGNDSLSGGSGNDTYLVDSATDLITELTGQGIDTVQSSVDFILTDNVENLTLTETAITATGNTLSNIITGNTGFNNLNGGDGNDTLLGGEGDDTLVGGNGNDILNGGSENDSLEGGNGNDTYLIDADLDLGTDTIIETTAGGADILDFSSTNTTALNIDLTNSSFQEVTTGVSLDSLSNIEDVRGGSLDDRIVGNSLNNVLSGGAGNDNLSGGTGNDSLNGGIGIDTLVGGLGNDIYVMDATADIINETSTIATEIDTVQASVNFSLLTIANVENLILTGTTAIAATGNTRNNTIVGNGLSNSLSGVDGNDVLRDSLGNDTLLGGNGNDNLYGGMGADRLDGGAGNDTYYLSYLATDLSNDIAIELAGGGVDTAFATFTVGLLANEVENLILIGTTAIDATGNTLSNTITGNIAANKLNGGDGNDTLLGGSGSDSLTGGNGNDSLSGGIGIDTLVGGLGNDIYVMDATADIITETSTIATEIDTVQSSVSFSLLTRANIENLTLTGTAIAATGNTRNNTIVGNGLSNSLSGGDGNDILRDSLGNDTLIGGNGNDNLYSGAGTDRLEGGAGNDTYFLSAVATDLSNDIAIELAGGGVDTAFAAFTVGLLANEVENLALLGATAIDATGNSLSNSITGNTAANKLNGGAGADALRGLAGADTFVFRFGQSSVTGVDRILDFAIGSDKIDLLSSAGLAFPVPSSFSRASDTAVSNSLATVVGAVYADANGLVAGNQALGLNSAVLFKVNAGSALGTYLAINDGIAGFQSATDLVVNITGFTGALPGVGAIAPSLFFV